MRQLSDSDEDEDEDQLDEINNDSTRYNILTRRKTLTMKSSSTLFNVKALSNISDLFHSIDDARKERNQLLQSSNYYDNNSPFLSTLSSNNNQNNSYNNGTIPSITSTISTTISQSNVNNLNNNLNSNIPIQLSSHYERSKLFDVIRHILTNKIAPKFCDRLWSCLLPRNNYPLSQEFASTIDPTSLYQRSIFTPAEDDLLLRGMIMTCYENTSGVSHTAEGTDWDEVQRRFLPSKDKRLLQYRQIQLISCEENSKFQRFIIYLFINIIIKIYY